MPGPILLIHGGAGGNPLKPLSPEREQTCRQALTEALMAGQALLRKGAPALDAVEAAVRSMEDGGVFNAGRGSVPTSGNKHECDAAIMDGSSRAGAIASVRCVKNPVAAARAVMEDAKHVLLAGFGAEEFARARKLEFVDDAYYTVAASEDPQTAPHHGTVGAVALDQGGRLAAATSTGGTRNKSPGRVGDSPLIGAGTYADLGCAVSATGTGEFFIRTVFAHNLAARRRWRNDSIADAASAALDEVTAIGGDGGCIAVDREGNFTMPFSTHLMYRGWIDGKNEPRVAIYRGDESK